MPQLSQITEDVDQARWPRPRTNVAGDRRSRKRCWERVLVWRVIHDFFRSRIRIKVSRMLRTMHVTMGK
jgi:hypothetical protein